MRRILRTVICLCIAACIGVMVATSATCAVGLFHKTSTWCGPGILWPIGMALAIPNAMLLGIPASLAFDNARLTRWWQFALGGVLISVPAWYVLATPFSSQRWEQVGLYDSLNYLGTGAISGVVFWMLRLTKDKRDNH